MLRNRNDLDDGSKLFIRDSPFWKPHDTTIELVEFSRDDYSLEVERSAKSELTCRKDHYTNQNYL